MNRPISFTRKPSVSYVVISSFENVDTGDLQAQGESIAVFADEASARAHFAKRSTALEAAAGNANTLDGDATLITWTLLLRMPLEVSDAEQALEDLELVIEETGSIDDPFGELVVAYAGRRHAPTGAEDYPREAALRGLEAWLT
jgi:hypothetical protein